MPNSTYSQEDLDYVASVFPEVNDIQSEELRRKVLEIWIDIWHESKWERIEDAPKNPENVGDRRLYVHIRAVTLEALATAEIMQRLHDVPFDRDVMIAGGLLHDVSKLVEYEPKGTTAGKSARGKLIQHAVYGAHMAWEKGLPDEIVHIIISHTHNSGHKISTWEGVVIHYVDYLDSDALLHAAGQKLLVSK
jgi:putative nucleotidyltransferase with HDIG domain